MQPRRYILVTLETDGLRDYVKFADGNRKILGTVSVLSVVSKCSPRREQRSALDAFNKNGSCVVTVDLDILEALVAPKYTKWANDLLIPHVNQPSLKGTTMNLLEQLGKIEETVTRLDKYAKEGDGLIAPKLHEGLRQLTAGIHFYNPGDQSKNDAWYTPGGKVDTVDGEQPKLPKDVMHAKTAAQVTTLKANTEIAESILEAVNATSAKVDALVTAGRKFNASKAQEDLYVVASRVSEIINTVDLSQEWVSKDLGALSKRASELSNLFASAKA